MNKHTQSKNRQQKKSGQTNSSSKLRFFYILILLLMIFSLFTRVSGVGRDRPTGQAGGGTTARVLVFHRDDQNQCEDLAVTAAGSAVFSHCGKGIEKQYSLDNLERSQLRSWIDQYSPVNYDENGPSQTGNVTTQLYLKGQGKQQVDHAATRQMIDFATALAAKIASRP